MRNNFKISFEISDYTGGRDAVTIESIIEDLLKSAVLPAIGAELSPLTLTVTKKRG